MSSRGRARRAAKSARKRAAKAERRRKIDEVYNIIPLDRPREVRLKWKQHQQAEGYYARYLESDWWKRRREQAKVDGGHKCNRCGALEDLQVHHRSYARLWAERPEDLEVLCRLCHRQHHGLES